MGVNPPAASLRTDWGTVRVDAMPAPSKPVAFAHRHRGRGGLRTVVATVGQPARD